MSGELTMFSNSRVNTITTTIKYLFKFYHTFSSYSVLFTISMLFPPRSYGPSI